MLLESAPAASPTGTPRAKYRIRFRKAGDLRLVSHHDLMHFFERLFRRAGLPVPVTQGFNPRPRMWFAQSLALGIVGANEVLELELTDHLPAENLQERLARQCPPGIDILSVRAIDPKAGAQVRRAVYRLALAGAPPDLAERIDAFLERSDFWVERTRPQSRRINLRPYVSALTCADNYFTMSLWISPNGSPRPEEILEALGLAEMLSQGAILERTDLELCDELPEGEASMPELPPTTAVTKPKEPKGTPVERRPTPLVTGPLSFDS